MKEQLPARLVLSAAAAISLLLIAGCSGRSSPAPVETLYTGKTFRDFEPNSLTADTYQVQAGETLYSIAFRANRDVNELADSINWMSLYHLPRPDIAFIRQSRTSTSAKIGCSNESE